VSLKILEPDERVAVSRGETVVAVPLYSAHKHFVRCFHALTMNTPEEVPILIADDASPDDRSLGFLQELDAEELIRHNVLYRRGETNQGFVGTVNDIFALTAPGDVVLLNSDCMVAAQWLNRIHATAAQSALVATVSVLTNHGTILSVPNRNGPAPGIPQDISLEGAAARVAAESRAVRPHIPTGIGHCLLVSRRAVELVGPFDVAFSPGYGEEVDFSQRCVQRGLVHLVADDVFVLHEGSVSFARRPEGESRRNLAEELRARHERMIDVRYPYYAQWVHAVAHDEASPLARSLSAARRAFRGLTVTIDGRCLTPIVTGTQVHTLEVIAAMSREQDLHVRVVLPPDVGEYAAVVLNQLGTVETMATPTVDELAGVTRTDVVHRTFQISSYEDLELMRALGERLVVTHQDLIAFNAPGYFPSFDAWWDYRELTRLSLSVADRVVFFSRFVAEEALREELLERDRAEVIYLGTDHSLPPTSATRQPTGISRLAGKDFLLCLGTDFAHKNRVFALMVLKELRVEHGWDGGLVFAGPHVTHGSSASDEAEFTALHPSLQDVVVDLASVDNDEKQWLLEQTAMMFYPSVHEGFGLVPFESAAAGTACAFAAQTAVGELLPSRMALIEPWNARSTAERILPYLRSPEACAQLVSDINSAAAHLTWGATGRALRGAYEAAARTGVSEARRLARELTTERALVEAGRDELEASRQDRDQLLASHTQLCSEFDSTARGLVGEHGVIPSDLRRPLLAIGNRAPLRLLVFGPMRFLYLLGYRVRHLGRGPDKAAV
jgi:GT2 family glycosyltransferase/glycosyltransferase involved in cell wall biosynthesis